MLPSERVRLTRRRRLAHLGVGGVIFAASSVRIATAEPAAATPELAVTAVARPTLLEVRRVHERANRSLLRHRIHASRLRYLEHLRELERRREAAAAARAAPPPVTSLGWPWPELAGCESGGHWSEVTGNGFLWGLQFVASTWDANRGSLPTAESYLARGAAPTPAEQVEVGRRIEAGAGWGAWPACADELGLR